jgi:hypothetical protein
MTSLRLEFILGAEVSNASPTTLTTTSHPHDPARRRTAAGEEGLTQERRQPTEESRAPRSAHN